MKNKIKCIGIIVFVSVIGFSLTVCGDDGDKNPYIPTTTTTELTGTVSITGIAMVGETLTADITDLSGTGTVTYKWKRGDTNIGTNNNTYVVVEADLDSTITVSVTRIGYSGTITSDPTAIVVAAGTPELTGTVTINGTAMVGKTLTASTSGLNGSGTLTYQWKRGTTNIGTNNSSYVIVDADVGSTITVTVSRAGYAGTKTSAPTAVVVRPYWTIVTNSTFGSSDFIYSVTYGGATGQEKFVAVGASGKMAYSADGKTWTAVNNSTFSSTGIIRDVIYDNQFIAVGASGKMAYSSDGITWTAIITSAFDSYTTIYGIAANIYYYVAVGADGKMAYCTSSSSSAPTTWTTVTSTFGAIAINSVASTGAMGSTWIAVGANGKMARCNNSTPTSWTAVTDSTFGTTAINDVAYGGDNFVAVGNSGKMAYSTDRGFTWTAVTNSTFGTNAIRSVAWNGGTKGYGGMFVAVGSEGKAAYSADGITWTAVTDGSFGYEDIYNVAFHYSISSAKIGVAVGSGGKIAYNINE